MTDPPRHPARRSLPTLPDVQPSGAAAPSMRGPLPTSNWVVPGLLLCGAEPDGPAALRLVMLGVRVFVCLQSELPGDAVLSELEQVKTKKEGIFVMPLERITITRAYVVGSERAPR